MCRKLGGPDCRTLTKSPEIAESEPFHLAKSHIAVQHFVRQNVD
jgi:hypothetical protein